MAKENQVNWDDDDGNLDDDEVETEGDDLNESGDDEDDWDDSEELEEDYDDDESDAGDEDNYDRIDGEENDLVGRWSGDHIYGRDKEMSEFEDAYYSQMCRSFDSDYRPENIYTDGGDDLENV